MSVTGSMPDSGLFHFQRKELTYVDRMYAEHKELNERVRKLKAKIDNAEFMHDIGVEKANLLIAQYHAMETYSFILAQRLALEGVDA